MRSFVACWKRTKSVGMSLVVNTISLTPKGQRVIAVASPVQVGLSGGDAAKVLPAIGQSIGHAVAVMIIGGRPESKMGDGREPEGGEVL